jgi:hypothetical protein
MATKNRKSTSQPTMTRTAMFLRADQIDGLTQLSDLTGAPLAELIRRAIDAYLESRKGELDTRKK